jgi:hypothetical protein
MNPWFEEKAQQINVPSMMAFGIKVITRHARAHEMSELLMFAREAAKSNVNIFVEEVFYDSNSDCCAFKFTKAIEQFSNEERSLLIAATKTISQFELFGTVHHGQVAPNSAAPL